MLVQDLYIGAQQMLGKEEGPSPSSFVDRVPFLLNFFFPNLNPFRETALPEVTSFADDLDISGKESMILTLYLLRQMALESEGISDVRLSTILTDFDRAMASLTTGVEQLESAL